MTPAPVPPASGLSDERLADERLANRARQHLRDLCNGDERWRMCVPVHPDDSDEIFGAIIRRFNELSAEVERTRSDAALGAAVRETLAGLPVGVALAMDRREAWRTTFGMQGVTPFNDATRRRGRERDDR